ncbi:reverse transcriptase domain-containing protein [Tanacetum coccineum]
MADQRTMAELLRAPTEGYAEAIVDLEKGQFLMTTSFACRWLKKEPPRSILTWEDLVSKFINEFFPPSRTTNLRNEISNFLQKFDESFHEAWDRYKDLLRACPHHGFTELHQLETFYNALNPADQDSLNSAAGGNLLERWTQDVLTFIENKSKVCNSRNKLIVSQVKSSDGNSSSSSDIAKLTHAVNEQTSVVTTAMMAILKQFQATPTPASVKAVEEICVINTVANPRGELKAITTRSGLVLDGPTVPMPPPFINLEEDERVEETLTDLELGGISLSLELANELFCTPKGIARDVFVPVRKFTFPADFVIVDYESDLRVPLILGRPFLQTARALIDVHGEEMILHDDLFATNHQSGNLTSFLTFHTDLTSPEVNDDIFDPEGDIIKNLLNLDKTNEFADELAHITFPPRNDDFPFDAEFDLREIEYLLNHDPIKEMDSILEDSVDENSLDDNLNDTF